MRPKGPYSAFCGQCGLRKSDTLDPHTRCRQCKALCTLEERCDQCHQLPADAFLKYRAAIRKSETGAKRKKALREGKGSARDSSPVSSRQSFLSPSASDSFVVR